METLLKIFSVLTIFFFTIDTANSANELFRSAASGNWNAVSTWQMSTNGGGIWFAATSVPRDTSGTITIRNPNTVTVSVSTTANQMVIDSGGVLAINAGIILTIPDGSGNDITASKGCIINGPGTVRTQGNVEINLRGGSAFNAVLNVNTGITYAFDQTSPYDGSLFGNLIVDAGATLNCGNISGRHLSIFGSVTNNGTITASSTGGSYSINGPSLVNNGTLTCAGTVYFDSITSVSGSGLFTPSVTLVSGTVTLLSNITYSPSSYISMSPGGVLNPNGNTFTITGGSLGLDVGAEISSPGTVKSQNTSFDLRPGSAFNANLNVNSGVNYAYSFASPYDGSLYGNLTIDAGATLNCGNISGRHLFIYGSIVNNGTLTASSTGGSYSINGPSLVNNGTVTAAGTVYIDSITSISGNGAFTPAVTLVSGNVTLLSNITYSPASYISMVTGGVLNPNGNTFILTSGNLGLQSGGMISSPGTVRTQNTVQITAETGSAFNANVVVNTGHTNFRHDISPFETKLYGNLTIDPGASINGGAISGRDLFVYGNVTNNGTISVSSGGGNLIVKGASFDNNGIVNTAGNFYFDTTTALTGSGSFLTHAIFTGLANVTLGTTHQMHSININAGGLFNISNRWLKLTASNPITATGTFTTTGSTVEYNGTSGQTISTSGITYSKLRINNASGTGLANNVTVNDSLIIQLGTLDLSGRVLTISPSGSLLESPGNVVKGTSGYLTTTRTINAPSSLNVAGFGAVLTTASNLGSTVINRGHTVQTGGSIRRYYEITPANNSGLNATLKFKYDNSELNLRPEAVLKLFKSTNSGVNWTNMGGTVNTSLNEITLSGLSSFSRWTADSSGVNAVINFAIQGYYNPSTNRLNMEDTVRIYLRQISLPYSIVDSTITLLDSALLKAACVFPNVGTGTYYIQIKHRNALETWSKIGGQSYTSGSTLNFDFLQTAANAFSGNQIQADASPVRFAIYGGDVNQDGFIDGSDGLLVDNDAADFESGYVTSDVDGNRFVDGSDAAIVDNNAFNFVSVAKP